MSAPDVEPATDRRAQLPLRTAVRTAVADLPAGALVLVALSGGPDSVALAAACAVELPAGRRRAGAVVVDHGLQPGSADVADRAAELARGLGLDPVLVRRVEVASGPGSGGPEAAARAARYEALDEAAERVGAVAVLLGHTLDDQAETVLLGLARGSGARSLSGMAAVTGRCRRPLLGLRRAAVRAAAQGLPSVDDAHNADTRFARARVRREALPALESALGPGVAEALARTADLLRSDADALDAWADRAVDAVGSPRTAYGDAGALHRTEGVVVDVEAEEGETLRGLPEAVRRRALRRLAVAAGVPAGALTYAHTVALDRLLTEPWVRGPVLLPGGVLAERVPGGVLAERVPGGVPAERVPGGVPAERVPAASTREGGTAPEAGSAPATGCGRLRLHRGTRPEPQPQPRTPPADTLVE